MPENQRKKVSMPAVSKSTLEKVTVDANLILVNVALYKVRIRRVIYKIRPAQAKGWFFVDCAPQPAFEPKVCIHGDN